MAENHKDIEIAAGGAPTAPYDALSPRKSVTKEAVSARVKQARERLRLGQTEMAKRMEMPLHYEAGKRIPGGEAIASFMAAGISANWLLTGHEPMLLADLQPPGSLDPARLRLAIEVIEEGLAGKVMPPDKKAEAVLAAYDLLEVEGVTKERVLKLVRVA